MNKKGELSLAFWASYFLKYMPALLCPEKNVKENYSNFQLNSVKDSCIDKSSEFAKIRFLALLKFSFFTAVFQESFSEQLSSGKPV